MLPTPAAIPAAIPAATPAAIPASAPPSALSPRQGLHVDIPLLPRATLGSALTLIDLLRTARMLAQLRLGALAPPISWRLLTAEGGAWPPALPVAPHPALPSLASLASRLEDYQGSAPPTGQGAVQHAVFLPPMHAADIPSVRGLVQGQGALVAALRQALDAGGLLACQGNSAWLAAATGRAADRALVLPWFYASAFRDDHPEVRLVADRACVAEAPWFSVAGAEQLGGLVCALLEHSTGPGLAQLCRPAFEFDPEQPGRGAGQRPDPQDPRQHPGTGHRLAGAAPGGALRSGHRGCRSGGEPTHPAAAFPPGTGPQPAGPVAPDALRPCPGDAGDHAGERAHHRFGLWLQRPPCLPAGVCTPLRVHAFGVPRSACTAGPTGPLAAGPGPVGQGGRPGPAVS